MAKPVPLPTRASVEIHGGCNYRCRMCPHTEGRERSFTKKLPRSTFERICGELADLGCERINLQGSGEPLLNRDFIEYVRIAHQTGLRTSIVTNGFFLSRELSEAIVREGMEEVRVSVIGYDRETYAQWMGKDALGRVFDSCRELLEVNRSAGDPVRLSSYHLILDPEREDWEVGRYRHHWIEPLGIPAEIWRTHNWSGNYPDAAPRSGAVRRSCGRPFAPYLNVRAGGVDGRHAAVVPCCFVLGSDSEAVLGHLSDQSIEEVWNGPAYERLRQRHREGAFDEVSYCRGCDQLYEAPESLVWTNIPGKAYGQLKNDPSLDFRAFGPGGERRTPLRLAREEDR